MNEFIGQRAWLHNIFHFKSRTHILPVTLSVGQSVRPSVTQLKLLTLRYPNRVTAPAYLYATEAVVSTFFPCTIDVLDYAGAILFTISDISIALSVFVGKLIWSNQIIMVRVEK